MDPNKVAERTQRGSRAPTVSHLLRVVLVRFNLVPAILQLASLLTKSTPQ